MHFLDISVIVIFLLCKLLIGIKAGLKVKNIREYTYGYGKFLTLTIVVAIFSTYVDGESLIYSSAHFYMVGLVGIILIIANVLNLVLIAKIAPMIFSKYHDYLSVGHMMESVYGFPSRIVTGVLVLLMSIIVIAVQIRGVSVLGNFFFGIDKNKLVWIIGIFIMSYSAFGGVRSVTWTDFLKFFAILFIFPITFISIIGEVDFAELSSVREYEFDPKILLENFWYYIILIFPIFHPPIIQRVIMASSEEQAKKSFYIVSLFVAVFIALIGISGFICYIKYSQIDPYSAIFYIMDKHTPSGTKGLLICGLLSLIMSSADSYINTAGVSLMNDLIKPVFPKFTNYYSEIFIAKFSTVIVGLLSCLVLLIIDNMQILIYLANLIWGSTISIPFLASIFIKNINKQSFYVSIFSTLFAQILFVNIFSYNVSYGFFAFSLLISITSFVLFNKFSNNIKLKGVKL